MGVRDQNVPARIKSWHSIESGAGAGAGGKRAEEAPFFNMRIVPVYGKMVPFISYKDFHSGETHTLERTINRLYTERKEVWIRGIHTDGAIMESLQSTATWYFRSWYLGNDCNFAFLSKCFGCHQHSGLIAGEEKCG